VKLRVYAACLRAGVLEGANPAGIVPEDSKGGIKGGATLPSEAAVFT